MTSPTTCLSNEIDALLTPLIRYFFRLEKIRSLNPIQATALRQTTIQHLTTIERTLHSIVNIIAAQDTTTTGNCFHQNLETHLNHYLHSSHKKQCNDFYSLGATTAGILKRLGPQYHGKKSAEGRFMEPTKWCPVRSQAEEQLYQKLITTLEKNDKKNNNEKILLYLLKTNDILSHFFLTLIEIILPTLRPKDEAAVEKLRFQGSILFTLGQQLQLKRKPANIKKLLPCSTRDAVIHEHRKLSTPATQLLEKLLCNLRGADSEYSYCAGPIAATFFANPSAQRLIESKGLRVVQNILECLDCIDPVAALKYSLNTFKGLSTDPARPVSDINVSNFARISPLPVAEYVRQQAKLASGNEEASKRLAILLSSPAIKIRLIVAIIRSHVCETATEEDLLTSQALLANDTIRTTLLTDAETKSYLASYFADNDDFFTLARPQQRRQALSVAVAPSSDDKIQHKKTRTTTLCPHMIRAYTGPLIAPLAVAATIMAITLTYPRSLMTSPMTALYIDLTAILGLHWTSSLWVVDAATKSMIALTAVAVVTGYTLICSARKSEGQSKQRNKKTAIGKKYSSQKSKEQETLEKLKTLKLACATNPTQLFDRINRVTKAMRSDNKKLRRAAQKILLMEPVIQSCTAAQALQIITQLSKAEKTPQSSSITRSTLPAVLKRWRSRLDSVKDDIEGEDRDRQHQPPNSP